MTDTLSHLTPRRGAVFVLGAAVLWGTTGTAQALGPAAATPETVGAIRLAIGGLALLAMALTRGALPSGRPWPVRSTLLAAAGMAAYQPLFFAGVSRIGVGVGTIVAIGSAPILAGVLGIPLLGERPSRRWGAATALAIAGCVFLLWPEDSPQVHIGGLSLALGAGASYALYAVASKELLERHAADAVAAVVFSLAALGLAPLLVLGDLSWLQQPRGWMVALHLGLIATTAAYWLFTRGLAAVPAASAVTLSLAEPLTAAALGIIALGERLPLTGLIGIGFLLVGLAILTVRREGAA